MRCKFSGGEDEMGSEGGWLEGMSGLVDEGCLLLEVWFVREYFSSIRMLKRETEKMVHPEWCSRVICTAVFYSGLGFELSSVSWSYDDWQWELRLLLRRVESTLLSLLTTVCVVGFEVGSVDRDFGESAPAYI